MSTGPGQPRTLSRWEQSADRICLAWQRRNHSASQDIELLPEKYSCASRLSSWIMFDGIACMNERVGTSLDRCCKFLKVFSNVTHVVEQLVDIFGVDIKGFIHSRSGVGHIGKGSPQIHHGLANVAAVLADDRVDVAQSQVCFRGSCSKILQKGLQFFANRVGVSKSC